MVVVLLFALVGFILIVFCPLKNKKAEDKSNNGNSTNLVGEKEIMFSNSSLYNYSQIRNGTQTRESETNSLSAVGLWTLFGFSCFITLIVVGIICECNCRWLKKLFLIAYFYPLPISDDDMEVELIKVKFDAWEYAGCDTLWAGIITCLCDKLEERFGEYPSRYFRRIKDEYKKKVDPISQSRSKPCCKSMYGYMMPYTCCCIPKYIWILAAVPLFFPVVILPILFSLESLKHLFTGILGAIATVSFTVCVIKLSFFLSKSTKSYIEILQRKMSRPDFKEELGFMHLVKQEVELLNALVGFMENFERKRFRIVLLVDDLDRCENIKVLKMLEAISILLSEPNTRFISLIAVDPRVVVKSLELTVIKDFIKDDSSINGHEYLKKIIHLPIWLPEMEDDKVNKLVESYMPSEEIRGTQQEGTHGGQDEPTPGTSMNDPSRATSRGSTGHENIELDVLNNVDEDAFKKALTEIKAEPQHVCHNPRSVKRICNVLNLAIRLYTFKGQGTSEENIKRLVTTK